MLAMRGPSILFSIAVTVFLLDEPAWVVERPAQFPSTKLLKRNPSIWPTGKTCCNSFVALKHLIRISCVFIKRGGY